MPTISLSIDASQAKKGAAEAEQALGKVKRAGFEAEKATNAIGKSFSNAGSGLPVYSAALTGLATAVGSGVLVKAGRNALQFADDLNAVAASLNLNPSDVQTYRAIFADLNVDAGTTDGALRKFSRGIGLAAGGTGTAKKAFDELGIDVRTLGGDVKSTNELFQEAVDKISSLKSPQEQAAEATRLFGSAGTALLPILNSSAGSFKELKTQVEASGEIMSDDLVKASDAANSALEKTERAIKGTFRQAFVKEFVGEFGSIDTALKENIKSFELLGTAAGKVLEGILKGVAATAKAINDIKRLPSNISSTLEIVGKSLLPGKLDPKSLSDRALQYNIDSQKEYFQNYKDAPEKGIFSKFYKKNDSKKLKEIDNALDKSIKPFVDEIEFRKNKKKNPFVGALDGREFGGFRAKGGNVDPSKYYVVGEEGPELFLPEEAGNITTLTQKGSSKKTNESIRNTNYLLEETGDILDKNTELATTFGNTLNQSLSTFLQSQQSGSQRQSVGGALKGLGLDLLQNVGTQILLPQLQTSFKGYFDRQFGTSADYSTSSDYTVGGGFSNYSGARAMGGPVKSNRTYLVGENGPEMFTPQSSGNISKGGQTVIVNIQAKDAQSFIQSKAQIGAAISNAAKQGLKNL